MISPQEYFVVIQSILHEIYVEQQVLGKIEQGFFPKPFLFIEDN